MTKILIADDERFERELLSQILSERFSGEVQTRFAENGRQAIETASLWDADIILMDIQMPGIDGIEAAKRILAQHPDRKVIFITAHSLFSYAYEALKLGAVDYILKPVNADDLERSVRHSMEQSAARRELAAMASVAEGLSEAASYDKTTLLMNNVRQYLRHNYMLYDVSLDSISAILNINSSYFSVLFKKHFCVNFVDYLTELRMNAAKDLLRDPFLAAADVAGMVGYESPNYFTRAFKKNTGMTPTQYRRSLSTGTPSGEAET